jgi:hypothetical protein
MYLSPSENQKLVARLVSPLTSKNNEQCLTFYYHMDGATQNELSIYLNVSTSSSLIWSKNFNQGNRWVKGVASINPNNNFRITFLGSSESNSRNVGDIALDDISLKSGPCPNLADCDFEDKDLCGWTSVKDNIDFEWIVHQSGTDSYNTGPSADHTLGTSQGKYIYIETSYPANQGDKARIESPIFDKVTGDFCMEFWYHMYGSSIGTLNIIQKTLQAGTETTVWSLSGNKGDMWKLGRLPIYSDERYSILAEGIVGTSYDGDIAVDDISFTNTYCSYNPSDGLPTGITLRPTTTLSTNYIALNSSDTSFDCDFEKSFCGWKIDSTTNNFLFNWIRKQGINPSSPYLPGNDHSSFNISKLKLKINP